MKTDLTTKCRECKKEFPFCGEWIGFCSVRCRAKRYKKTSSKKEFKALTKEMNKISKGV